MKLIEDFGSDDECREYLTKLRWPNGVACLKCGSVAITDLPKRNLHQCSDCRYQFSVTTDTIMHDSHLPLRKWMVAIYLIVESKKSLSAAQLGRKINVQYRTAWYLAQRIREALKTPGALLSGIIEVDETFIGGKAEGKGRGFKGNKTIVVGAAQRGGEIRMETAPDTSRPTLRGFIDEYISDSAEAIHTDEHSGYKGATGETPHETVNHSQDEWVRGNVHTNTIEGMWSLFKRGVVGSFHHVSRKHLDRYLDEFEFRFNNRENPFIFRDALRELLGANPIQYRELVG